MTHPSEVYTTFFTPGEVTEIRAYGCKRRNSAWEGWAGGAGIVAGYFDNADAFGKCADALDKAEAPGIYFTLNPVNPDLLARAANRLKAADVKTSLTTDKDILFLRWLYLDLDPVRPSGISSTDEELRAAIELRDKIHEWFAAEKDYRDGIRAVSGNGAHLMVRIKEIPNTEEKVQLIKKTLHFFHHKFSTSAVEVDRSVYNPSRICKVYGTVARKGDHTDARPHRRSYIERGGKT